MVRKLLIQKELGEKRANWVTTLQEYNLEIKPTKIVRGQCFCRLITRINDTSVDEPTCNIDQVIEVPPIDIESQYADLIFYLKNGNAPSELDFKRKRALRLKFNQYQLINGVFLIKNYDSIFLICLEKVET